MYVVDAVRPVSVTECEVTSVLLSVDKDPYAVVVPYFTCVLDAWSVVQLMAADVEVMLAAVTALNTGAGSAMVANVKFVEVPVVPKTVEMTA